jgi:cytochrome P450
MSTDTHTPSTDAIGSLMEQEGLEPWAWFDQVRSEGGVVWDEAADSWLVTNHEAVREFLMDEETFARPEEVAGNPQTGRFTANIPEGVDPEHWNHLLARMTELRSGSTRPVDLVAMSGDLHRHTHRWWIQTFSVRVLEQWREGTVRPLINDQIDKIEGDAVDLVKALIDPVVPRVMSGITGGHTDEAWARELSDVTHTFGETRLVQHHAEVPVELLEKAVVAGERLNEMLRPIVREKREGGDGDLISIVWRDAENLFPAEYGDYDENDVISVAVAIGRGGLSTVRSGTTCALYTLMKYPEIQQQLRADGSEEAIKRFVEEALRLNGPVDMRPRVAREDTVLAGTPIKAGESVIALQISANRDSEHYDHPGEVDLQRSAPRDHYSFGKGPRVCPGHGLGRMVIGEVVRTVLDRFDELSFDPDAAPPVFKGLILRSWEPLNARLVR